MDTSGLDAEQIFNAASRITDPGEQAAYLDSACGADAELRARVDALLAAEAKAGGFLESADADPHATIESPGPAADAARTAEHAGQVIGRYTLREKIGEGGFGTVWVAEQTEPVKRRVALKIIKLGMDTRQVIARFEAERQALALMDHPNISKVFDAGSTETGRPYFVMEYVRGVGILEYCDTEKLDTRSRLDLFIKVCQAIQHAHQKGIIHRDVKPSNVLVTLHDGVPVPKVIDFGIAKATSAELTQKTIYTEHRQMIGTPAYMSPEQAEMSGLDIDTRTDVYSLGVLLYELLTGTTPFDGKSLLQAGYAEMMRIIREEEPHKPSTRLSTLGDTASRTAEQRRIEIGKLSTLLRGDLDWIVMKCLEKDRTRRYETANGLAADIRRHLSDEPVVAGPPTAGYRVRKFVRRNRAGVLAGSAIAVLLVLGVVGTSIGMVWAFNEKSRADDAATRANLAAAAETAAKLTAQENEQKAVEEAERAERELARATEIKHLIKQMLESVTPEQARGADTVLLEGILEDAAERLASGEITDELIAAELHGVVAEVYRRLGLFEDAERHLPVALEIRTRMLGDKHPHTLTSLHRRAVLYQNQGLYTDAEPLVLEAFEKRSRVLGPEHQDTLRSMHNVALLHRRQGRHDQAESWYVRTLEIQERVLGKEHPDTLLSLGNLTALYAMQGRYAEAEPLALETLEIKRRVLGEDHPHTLGSLGNLAALYRTQGRYTEAEPLIVKSLDIQRDVLGEEHPDTLEAMYHLATLYTDQDRRAEAETLHLETLETQTRVLGEEHPSTLHSMNNLASQYRAQGRYAEAQTLFVKVLEIEQKLYGEAHPDALRSLANVALLYQDQGRLAEAEPLALKALKLRTRELGEEHPDTLTSINNLALLYQQQGRSAEAEPLLHKALEVRTRLLGEEHPDTLPSMNNLANHYFRQGRYADAEPLYVRALEIHRRMGGEEHTNTLGTMNNLANLFLAQGRFDEAEPLFVKMLDVMTPVLGDEHPQTLSALTNLGLIYNATGQYQDAAKMFETSLPITKRVLGMQHPWTRNAMNGLVEAYRALHRDDQVLALEREMLDMTIEGAAKPDAGAGPLNAAAWVLLTHENHALRDPQRALTYAERACAMEKAARGGQLHHYLDTLALAQHETGDNAAAVETQRKALSLLPADDRDRAGYEKRLAEYEVAADAGKLD